MLYSAKLTCWETSFFEFGCNCENVTAEELERKLQGYAPVTRQDWEGKERFSIDFPDLASHYTLEIKGSIEN